MSDKDDSPNMTPLSSNSSGPGGTRAWSVYVVEGPENPQPEKTSSAPDQTESSVAMTGNEHIEDSAPAAELASEPDNFPTEADSFSTETERFVSEALESVEALTEQTVEDVPVEEDTTETDGETATSAEATEDVGVSTATPDESIDSAPEPELEPVETAADESVDVGTNKEQTTEQLRQAVRDSLAQHEAKRQEAAALFERISEDFSAMMAAARTDAAAFSAKFMEFAQANAQSNFELWRGYSNARSIPEIFTVQTDYLKRQLELLNSQAHELQALTAEVQNRRKAD